jgi:hypothetical protein
MGRGSGQTGNRKFANYHQGQPIPVYGDGESGRDYTYVDDVIVESSPPWLSMQALQPTIFRMAVPGVAGMIDALKSPGSDGHDIAYIERS